MACVLAETYTGKILYQGDNNNQMLLLHQQIMGRYPVKVGRKGHFWAKHFDTQGDFTEKKQDKVTNYDIIKKHRFTDGSTNDLQSILDPRDHYNNSFQDSDRSKFNLFKDLLMKMMHLDPSKRITPEQALEHPFLAVKKRSKEKKKPAKAKIKPDLRF